MTFDRSSDRGEPKIQIHLFIIMPSFQIASRNFRLNQLSCKGLGGFLAMALLPVAIGAPVAGDNLNIKVGTPDNTVASPAAAIGKGNTSNGPNSIAWGFNNQILAEADSGGAGGGNNIVKSTYGQVFGSGLVNTSFSSVILGMNSVKIGNEDGELAARIQWRPQDPILVVGNGQSSSLPSNAFVVLKNGAVSIPTGPLTVAGKTILAPDTGTVSNGGLLAVGVGSVASGSQSIALGPGATSSAYYTFATGSSSATAQGAIAMGTANTANGMSSFAGGYGNIAGGVYSPLKYTWDSEGAWAFAYGAQNEASSIGSVAMGQGNIASAPLSVGLGLRNKAMASGAVSLGYANRAWRLGQTTVGRCSADAAAPANVWALSDTDEVFVVGGGSGETLPQRKNAMIVQANGNTQVMGTLATGGSATVAGSLTVGAVNISSSSGTLVFDKPIVLQPNVVPGDIPMYTGN